MKNFRTGQAENVKKFIIRGATIPSRIGSLTSANGISDGCRLRAYRETEWMPAWLGKRKAPFRGLNYSEVPKSWATALASYSGREGEVVGEEREREGENEEGPPGMFHMKPFRNYP